MTSENTSRNSFGMVAFGIAMGVAVGILAAHTVIAPRSAKATPAFTAETKLPCTQCHTAIQGAGVQNLTEFGKQFHANGNKLPKK